MGTLTWRGIRDADNSPVASSRNMLRNSSRLRAPVRDVLNLPPGALPQCTQRGNHEAITRQSRSNQDAI